MKPPSFVRSLTVQERQALRAGLRSPEAFTLRRCLVLLNSADGQTPRQIAAAVGCCVQSVRNAIRAFHAQGLDCLREKSSAPKATRQVLDDAGCRRLRDLLHRSPRDFGKPTSVWTLALAAEVAHAEGLTGRPVSIELIRQALRRLGVCWRRAKDWITSPDPAYLRKKGRATG
ncbi:MAG TPA: helix-turn-helix domain-containing protein [Candidatus Limnocylindrales bacterium]|nr:helix-turn-helix domain-containing protein [Candidatus Limnocylindrales bacterium]